MQHKTHLPGGLPRSRTMDVLSNLATSFSRQSLNPGDSRQASSSSIHVTDITTLAQQTNSANSNSYWCGRFQSVNDRFHNEVLLMDLETLREFISDDSPSPSPPPTPPPTTKARGKAEASTSNEDTQGLAQRPATQKIDDQDKRSIRVFLHLQGLCTTSEARKSLWEFQLLFARMEGKPHLLPSGGKMAGELVGLAGLAGLWLVGLTRALGHEKVFRGWVRGRNP